MYVRDRLDLNPLLTGGFTLDSKWNGGRLGYTLIDAGLQALDKQHSEEGGGTQTPSGEVTLAEPAKTRKRSNSRRAPTRESTQAPPAPLPPPLTEPEQAVLDVIRTQPPGQGITGIQIIDTLRMRNPPVKIEQSTLTRHFIPKLKQGYGVRNRRSAGYYVEST